MKQSRQDQYYQSQNALKNQKSDNSSDPEQEDLDETGGDVQKAGKWTTEEDDLLRKYVPLYGEKQWRKIAEYVPGRSSIQCLHRWTKILKPGLIKGPWTQEEDQKLIAWVSQEGPNKWTQAAQFIRGRSGKQCRERWFNNLNPDVRKGGWTEEEDEKIFELYQTYGSSWSRISKLMPGRTENAIKNRFYSTLRKIATDKKKFMTEFGADIKQELANEMSLNIPEKRAAEGQNYNTRQNPNHTNNTMIKSEMMQPNANAVPPITTNRDERAAAAMGLQASNALYKLLHHETLSVGQKGEEEGDEEEEEEMQPPQQQNYTYKVKQETIQPQGPYMMKANNKLAPQTYEQPHQYQQMSKPQTKLAPQANMNYPNMYEKHPGMPENAGMKMQNYNRTGYENQRPSHQINMQIKSGNIAKDLDDKLENDSELEDYIMDLVLDDQNDEFEAFQRTQFNNQRLALWYQNRENTVFCYENGDVRGTFQELDDLSTKISNFCQDNIIDQQPGYHLFLNLTKQEFHNQDIEHKKLEMPQNTSKNIKEPIAKETSKMPVSSKEFLPPMLSNLEERPIHKEAKDANFKNKKPNKPQSFSPKILSNPPKNPQTLKIEQQNEADLRSKKGKAKGPTPAGGMVKIELSNLHEQQLPIQPAVNHSFTPKNKKEIKNEGPNDSLQLGQITSNQSFLPRPQKKPSLEISNPIPNKPTKNESDKQPNVKLDLPQLSIPQSPLDLLPGLAGSQALLGSIPGLAGMLPGKSRGIADIFSGFKLGAPEPKEELPAPPGTENIGNLYQMVNSMMSDPASNGEDKISFLFKQLYSLENLLSSTRVELAQLETNIHDPQPPNAQGGQPAAENELKINFGQMDQKDGQQNEGPMNLWNLLLKHQKPS